MLVRWSTRSGFHVGGVGRLEQRSWSVRTPPGQRKHRMLLCRTPRTHTSVCVTQVTCPWRAVVTSVHNVHSHFPPDIWANVRIVHGKIVTLLTRVHLLEV